MDIHAQALFDNTKLSLHDMICSRVLAKRNPCQNQEQNSFVLNIFRQEHQLICLVSLLFSPVYSYIF